MGFLTVVLFGAVLLMLPISSASGNATGFLDALFTSVSATCVTGLVVVETGTYWSLFGKLVILLLIQTGGLGFMSIALFFSIIAGRKITPRERFIFAQSMNVSDLGGIVKFARFIVFGTFAAEAVGAVLLSFRLIPDYGIKSGILKSIFHSVSAFCNAGFDTLGKGNSVGAYVNDPLVSIVLSILVIIGGLGFFVWRDVYSAIHNKTKLTVYSKLVLKTTVMLLTAGTVLIFIFENNNPAFDELSRPGLFLASFFQSTVTRTAGFASINLAELSAPSKAISMLLMFIGGASGSTAGGIKVATIALILIAVISTVKGKEKFTVCNRSISVNNIMRAMGIFSVGISVILISVLLICFAEPHLALTDVLYEVISAFATVGQSLGITPMLGVFSKLILIFLMFFGRVGILTVTYSIMLKQAKNEDLITYPETNIFIG